MKAEIANSLNGTSIKTIYDPYKKSGDPRFIHVNDPPRETRGESTDKELMTQARQATTKPKDVSHDGAAIQPSSVPSECDGDVDLEKITSISDAPIRACLMIIRMRCSTKIAPENVLQFPVSQ